MIVQDIHETETSCVLTVALNQKQLEYMYYYDEKYIPEIVKAVSFISERKRLDVLLHALQSAQFRERDIKSDIIY
jgi:hypothetical protein